VEQETHEESDLRQYVQIFKALSDETRQRILILLQNEPMNVGDIVSHFDLAQPTISRHLSVLRQARLVAAKRSNQHMIYSLSAETMKRCCTGFMSQFTI
jgi:DNA-binding transcriptional ArsR family regulator